VKRQMSALQRRGQRKSRKVLVESEFKLSGPVTFGRPLLTLSRHCVATWDEHVLEPDFIDLSYMRHL
jgi:hypothetical protein